MKAATVQNSSALEFSSLRAALAPRDAEAKPKANPKALRHPSSLSLRSARGFLMEEKRPMPVLGARHFFLHAPAPGRGIPPARRRLCPCRGGCEARQGRAPRLCQILRRAPSRVNLRTAPPRGCRAIQPSNGGYAPMFNAQDGTVPNVTREPITTSAWPMRSSAQSPPTARPGAQLFRLAAGPNSRSGSVGALPWRRSPPVGEGLKPVSKSECRPLLAVGSLGLDTLAAPLPLASMGTTASVDTVMVIDRRESRGCSRAHCTLHQPLPVPVGTHRPACA